MYLLFTISGHYYEKSFCSYCVRSNLWTTRKPLHHRFYPRSRTDPGVHALVITRLRNSSRAETPQPTFLELEAGLTETRPTSSPGQLVGTGRARRSMRIYQLYLPSQRYSDIPCLFSGPRMSWTNIFPKLTLFRAIDRLTNTCLHVFHLLRL